MKDKDIRNEIVNLISQKSNFDFNRDLMNKINNKNFSNNDFIQIGKDQIQSATLNSIRDNKKFEINAVKVLYSLPENSFTLINDDNNNIYLAKIKKFQRQLVEKDNDKFKEYTNKQNSKIKNNMLKTYDLYLNKKYEGSFKSKNNRTS